MRWLAWILVPLLAVAEEDCKTGECDVSGLIQKKAQEAEHLNHQEPSCRGFEKCPEWPMPYRIGEYPEVYPWRRITVNDFPSGFMMGVGTAAYQIEGAYNEGGRGASIWDTYTGANTVGMKGSVCTAAPCPLNSVMADKGATGNVANNHYHKYKDDVAMMKAIGLKYYRFSVAWPRIIPTGFLKDGVNQEGIQFYHNLLDELIHSGITPIITMYHWDLPQGLMDVNFESANPPCDSRFKQGWYECLMDGGQTPIPTGMNSTVANEFLNFAEILLKEYGSKVKMWATFNEAWTFTHLASGYGKAPSIQPYMDVNVWPKVAGHNVIFAHLKVMMKFREMQQNGQLSNEHKIFITNNQDWREPKTEKPEDIGAAHYLIEGGLGWYCDPIFGVNGEHDYPYSMRSTLPYMPKFRPEERELLKKNKPDAFGLNHYGTSFVAYDEGKYTITHGNLVQGKSSWLFRAAWGYRKLLNWVSTRYGPDIEIWGTESGWSDGIETALGGKNDVGRLTYYQEYLQEALNAIKEDGVKMKSFMAWSIMDNFEWEMGYAERFGCLWNEFLWETDPNAPSAESPIYNAYTGKITGKCGEDCNRPKVSPGPSRASEQTRHMRNSMLRLVEAWGTPTMLNGPEDDSFFQAATGVSICFGRGTYQTEDGPVHCSLESDVLSNMAVPA